jgi:hypothetical protein
MINVANDAAPFSLTNAFEVPVRPDREKGLTAASAERLAKKARELRDIYGHKGASFILNACGADPALIGELGALGRDWASLLDAAMRAFQEA